MVGFENVAALARSAGIVNARGTPSVAIGTYNATPIDMAGAYTVFANNGVHLKPWMLASVRNANGDIVADYAPEAKQVLDPRAAFLTQSLLENVMTFGTGAAARAHGFTRPRRRQDRHLPRRLVRRLLLQPPLHRLGRQRRLHRRQALQGADAAAPIWAEFMNRAIRLPQYSDMKPFTPPDGVQMVRIDRATNLPADETCPGDSFSAAFLVGTAPQGTCSHMGEDIQTLGQRIFNPQALPDAASSQPGSQPGSPENPTGHRNFFEKMFGIHKDKQQQQQPEPPPQPPQ